MKILTRLTTASLLAASATYGQPSSAHGPETPKQDRSDVASDIMFEAMPPGSNQRLRAPITIADGLEVIISDVVIPPNATVPAHYHPGEEFLYVISGSAIHVEVGKADQILNAGDSYVIPPEAVHAPRGGPDGARGIVFRIHKEGRPERILIEE